MHQNKSSQNIASKIRILVILFIVCLGIGYLFGRIMGKAEKIGITEKITIFLSENSLVISFTAFILVNLVILILQLIRYAQTKKRFTTIDPEQEEEFFAIESSLNLPVLLSSIVNIFNICMFAVLIQCFTDHQIISPILPAVMLIGYMLFLIAQVVIARSVVELVKKINPEKKGDVLDLRFMKEWENSSDEAQKLIMYQAAYKAFQTLHYLCMSMWVICFMLQLVFHTGILPVICITVIWIITVIVYSVECAKLER